MKMPFLSIIVALLLSACVAATPTPSIDGGDQDWRRISGDIVLDVADLSDIRWLFNQLQINNGLVARITEVPADRELVGDECPNTRVLGQGTMPYRVGDPELPIFCVAPAEVLMEFGPVDGTFEHWCEIFDRRFKGVSGTQVFCEWRPMEQRPSAQPPKRSA